MAIAEDDSDSHRRARVPSVKTRIVLTLIAAAALAGCGGSSGAPTERPSSRRSIRWPSPPSRSAAHEVTVTNLTPPGVEPHDLELSGSDIRTIARRRPRPLPRARISSRRSRRRSTRRRRTRVDLARDTERETSDPHVWLDPIRYAAIAERIGEELDRRPEAAALRGEAPRARPRVPPRPLPLRARRDRHEPRRVRLPRRALRARAGRDHGLSPGGRADPTRPRERRAPGARSRRDDGVLRDPGLAPARPDRRARGRRDRPPCSTRSKGLTEKETAAGEDYFSVMRENLAALRKALACR